MGPLGGKLFGETVYIAPDDIFFYNPTVNAQTGAITGGSAVNSFNPFLSADGKKYYVVIASRRSFLTGVEPLMDMTHSQQLATTSTKASRNPSWATTTCSSHAKSLYSRSMSLATAESQRNPLTPTLRGRGVL